MTYVKGRPLPGFTGTGAKSGTVKAPVGETVTVIATPAEPEGTDLMVIVQNQEGEEVDQVKYWDNSSWKGPIPREGEHLEVCDWDSYCGTVSKVEYQADPDDGFVAINIYLTLYPSHPDN